MSNEDKIRAEFEEWARRVHRGYNWDYFIGIGYEDEEIAAAFDGWMACVAIKDAEIADITKRKGVYFLEMCEVIDKNENLLEEIASRDLIIKELRELLGFITNFKLNDPTHALIKEALAKTEQHDTRVLEKYRLMRELFVLLLARSSCTPYGEAFNHMITEREAQLAELNKEK